ncbi:Phosphorylated carbohydrates phosphatase [compost metagenome]
MPVITISDTELSCKGILFDKDGTLLNFMNMWGTWADKLIQLIEGHLCALSDAPTVNAAEWLGLIYDEQGKVIGYDKTGPLAMATEEEVTAILAWRFYEAGMPWNEAVVKVREQSALAMVEIERSRPAHPLPGLVDFLISCSRTGISLGIVTSDTTKETLKHLEWMGIRNYFCSVVGRDRVTKGKPDPEMTSLALKEMGLSANDCILIGDSNGDMEMAKRAGIHAAIGIAGDISSGKEYLLDADYIVTGYFDIIVR